MFVLSKEGRSLANGENAYRDAEGKLCVWAAEDGAFAKAELLNRTTHRRWIVRRAVRSDYQHAGSDKRTSNRQCYRMMDKIEAEKEHRSMAVKITSDGMLVDVFEDYGNQRFAIASRAESEEEFVIELANAFARAGNECDWSVRLRALLPLAVDMCCKYRGYKAETVTERRELLAGDLEMPRG